MTKNVGKKELRNFGLTLSGAFIVIGALLYLIHRERGEHPYFFAIGGFLLFLTFFVPSSMRPIRKGWLAFGEAIGYVTSRIVLVILFYVIATPIGWLAKLFGERFLDLRFGSARKTFWEAPKHDPVTAKTLMESQF